MPYPIPEKPWSEEFAYVLVAVPSDRGFLRALKGHFGELGSIRQWGMEGVEADSADAAQRMLEAIDETWRLMEMAWPDLVLGYIDEVEAKLDALLQAQSACCGVLPGTEYMVSDDSNVTSSTDRGTGTYPDSMTEGEFTAYLCNAATAYAGQLIDFPDGVLVAAAGGLVTLVAYLVGFEIAVFIGLPAAAAAALFTVTGIYNFWQEAVDLYHAILDGTETTASNAAAALAAVEDDIICAIYTADTAAEAETAVRAVLDANLSAGWRALFSLYPIGNDMANIFNHEADDAPTATCSSCAPTPCATELTGFNDSNRGNWQNGYFTDSTSIRYTNTNTVNRPNYPVSCGTELKITINRYDANASHLTEIEVYEWTGSRGDLIDQLTLPYSDGAYAEGTFTVDVTGYSAVDVVVRDTGATYANNLDWALLEVF